MSRGVEWAAHCCILLDWLGPAEPVSTAKLAASFELPPAYLNKQLQALVRSGLLTSTPGVGGGFSLARSLSAISMLDVVLAVEGPDEAFQCTEIRRCGLGASASTRTFRTPCAIASAMHSAETEWRLALAARNLADIRDDAERSVPGLGDSIRRRFAEL